MIQGTEVGAVGWYVGYVVEQETIGTRASLSGNEVSLPAGNLETAKPVVP